MNCVSIVLEMCFNCVLAARPGEPTAVGLFGAGEKIGVLVLRWRRAITLAFSLFETGLPDFALAKRIIWAFFQIQVFQKEFCLLQTALMC